MYTSRKGARITLDEPSVIRLMNRLVGCSSVKRWEQKSKQHIFPSQGGIFLSLDVLARKRRKTIWQN